jgi:uncharacterized protein YcfL
MKLYILPLVALLMLAGCDASPNSPRNQVYVHYEVEAEGCIVKYINNPKGMDFFIAKCPAESETITTKRAKSSPQATVTTSTDLRKQLAEVEAKEKALAKLSDEEKALLGIKK